MRSGRSELTGTYDRVKGTLMLTLGEHTCRAVFQGSSAQGVLKGRFVLTEHADTPSAASMDERGLLRVDVRSVKQWSESVEEEYDFGEENYEESIADDDEEEEDDDDDDEDEDDE